MIENQAPQLTLSDSPSPQRSSDFVDVIQLSPTHNQIITSDMKQRPSMKTVQMGPKCLRSARAGQSWHGDLSLGPESGTEFSGQSFHCKEDFRSF